MSNRNSYRVNKTLEQNTHIALLNIVLDFVLSRNWTDYDDFSSRLSKQILANKPSSEKELADLLRKTNGAFFSLNPINKERFIDSFPAKEIIEVLREQVEIRPLTFADIFQETNLTSISEGKKLVSSLANMPERIIQEVLLDTLREKNATNSHERGFDTVLEIADLEHFTLCIKNKPFSFACVVKGYKSISSKTVTWKDISHQITKAYQGTFPDYLIIVLAKNPSDGLITHLTNYSKSVDNPYLTIMCDPVNLSRFLHSRGIVYEL